MQTVSSRPDPLVTQAPLAEIAVAVGTPAYVYSAEAIRSAYLELSTALAPVPSRIHYALKANSTLALARVLRDLGAGADANSVGEIEVALRAGFLPQDIIFTGVGKRPDELERAIRLGVNAINAESAGEPHRIAAIARSQHRTARVALRINPDIDAGSHPHISTGRRINKFGVPIEQATSILLDATRTAGLAPVGLHVHVGSQIVSLDPLTRAGERIVQLSTELRAAGVPLEHLDLGGGLGIRYDDTDVPGRAEYGRALASIAASAGLTLLLEPGRTMIGSSGLLLSRVVDVKESSSGPRFAVLDAGMTELMRPALYNAFHRIQAVQPRPGEPQAYDVVGPICESSDVFGRDRMLPPLEPGDLVAVLDTGAYASAMGSTYNRRPLPPEVLVDGDHWRVIRRRQTIEDLIALES